MDRESIVDFFKLDNRKTTLSLAFIGIGFVISLIYLWMLLFQKQLLGDRPHPIVLGLIAMISPLFGLGITYIYIFKAIPLTLIIVINILLMLQFLYWYYLACVMVYIRDKLFKNKEIEFYK